MIKELLENKKELLQQLDLAKYLNTPNQKEIESKIEEIDGLLLDQAIKLDSCNEHKVYVLHTIDNYTMYAIARKIGYSERQIYRIYAECIRKIES